MLYLLLVSEGAAGSAVYVVAAGGTAVGVVAVAAGAVVLADYVGANVAVVA